MSTFTNYLIVILIALIILLTFTYSTDYLKINLPFKKDIETSENSSEYENKFKKQNNKIYEKFYKDKDINKDEDINNFLIDTNFATIESENLNKELFIQTDDNEIIENQIIDNEITDYQITDYQMTENTNNVITNALRNI